MLTFENGGQMDLLKTISSIVRRWENNSGNKMRGNVLVKVNAGHERTDKGLTVFWKFAMTLSWKLFNACRDCSWFLPPKDMALATTLAHASVPPVATGRSILSAAAADVKRIAIAKAATRLRFLQGRRSEKPFQTPHTSVLTDIRKMLAVNLDLRTLT